ncbi:MAG: hypothetical protein IT324_00435 [Anaerolineae bacterium]|nr:hypothetical protein [Anaerolineae bacterium]
MSDSNHHLMTALDFTADDLESNQHGMLTERQQAVVRRKGWQQVRSLLLWGIYAGVMAVLYVLVQPSQTSWPLLSWAITILFSIGALGYLVMAIARWRDIRAALQNGSVQSVEGLITPEKKVRGGGFRRFRMGDIVFDISRAESLAFEDAAQYRVYYMPRSKILVAAERL